MTNESKRRRILEAKSVLNDTYRRLFTKPHWDIRNNRLLSNDRTFALVWAESINPSMPESYDNQRTSHGVVQCFKVCD